jgi:hypothetical protein
MSDALGGAQQARERIKPVSHCSLKGRAARSCIKQSLAQVQDCCWSVVTGQERHHEENHRHSIGLFLRSNVGPGPIAYTRRSPRHRARSLHLRLSTRRQLSRSTLLFCRSQRSPPIQTRRIRSSVWICAPSLWSSRSRL